MSKPGEEIYLLRKILKELKHHSTVLEEERDLIRSWKAQDKLYHGKTLEKLASGAPKEAPEATFQADSGPKK